MVAPKLLLLARLANIREDLKEVVDRLDDAMLEWAPATGMRTISGQLVEIAITEIQVMGRLQGLTWIPDDELVQTIGDLGSLDNLWSFLTSARADTIAILDRMSDEELEADAGIKLGSGGYDVPYFPRSEVFRKIIEHEAYHVGQLTSYLWAYGDDPYAWP